MSAYEVAGRIRKSLWAIRDYYDEVLEPTRNTSGVKLPVQAVDGDKMRYAARVIKHSPPPAPIDVLDARRDCHMDLLHFSRVIYMACTDINGEEIQTAVDAEDVMALCSFVDTWAERLAEEDDVEAAGCERDMAKHANKLRSIAAPERRDWMPIGDCPREVINAEGEHITCGGRVRAYPVKDDEGKIRFIVCPSCGYEDTLSWWMSQIVPEGADLAPADTVIACVVSRTFQPLTHAQLRQWAARGFVQRHGKDVKGRTLYSSKAVLAYAQHKTSELECA